MTVYVGIENEHEFYSQHYLDELFENDVSEALKKTSQGQERPRFEILRGISRDYARDLADLKTLRDPKTYAADEQDLLKRLLAALGFTTDFERRRELDNGLNLPVVSELTGPDGLPYLWVLPCSTCPKVLLKDPADSRLDRDPLELGLTDSQLPDRLELDALKATARELAAKNWFDLLNEGVFARQLPPRWVLLVAPRYCLLTDRLRFAQRRVLRFDLETIFGRRENHVLQALALLLSAEAFKRSGGQCLLDRLDENSYRHAEGVSADLKYAMRQSIELLGNEAARQLRAQREQSKKRFWSDESLAADLSAECLRYMYRLLFIFFAESRRELHYAPVDSELYLKGYSLELLRDLELVPLITAEDRNGFFFHETIQRLFYFYAHGTPEHPSHLPRKKSTVQGFNITALKGSLFDDDKLKLLTTVRFPNHLLQRVIELMSLSRDGKGKGRRGRISYAHLGINQLGAVYESLLSFRGFFAAETLYEVKPAQESEHSELDSVYLVTEQELSQYSEEERVTETDPTSGQKRYRRYAKGTFIYRMSGREREISASYYTPEVLTRCVVKEAIEVLSAQQLDALPDARSKAEKILTFKICEPAMGSAAFLNEAINQLSELYLQYATKVPGARGLTQQEYRQELQKVRMFLADRNVFGVDLNPTAVELAEVSLWLNALTEDKFVPWFGMQLHCGNSLIGCRRLAFWRDDLVRSPKDARPHEVGARALQHREIWHFLLPNEGMCAYDDKDARAVAPAALEKVKSWRKAFTSKLSSRELNELELLSAQLDALWQEWARELYAFRLSTTDPYDIYGHTDTVDLQLGKSSYQDKERYLREIVNGSEAAHTHTKFPLLKRIMDLWCALWFWPLDEVDALPTRTEFIGIVKKIANAEGQMSRYLDPNRPQSTVTESDEVMSIEELFENPPTLPDGADNGANNAAQREEAILKIAREAALRIKFMHWPLRFADIFLPQDGSQPGFDLTLGNPPWATVSFETATVLGDFNPLYVIHKSQYNAKAMQDVLLGKADLDSEGRSLFERQPQARTGWLRAYEESAGAKSFFNSEMMYPELKGSGSNLFKLFLPTVWRNSAPLGVQGLLHPETVYNETKGLALRSTAYTRLRRHYQFANELKLFADVHHETEFSVNIYGSPQAEPDFESINNLFLPATIESCRTEQDQPLEGIKDSEGRWNIQGHPERILHFDAAAFARLSQVFNTDPKAPVLPGLHAVSLLHILEHFASCSRVGDLQCKISSMWHESGAQKDGTIKALPGNHTVFSSDPKQAVLNAVHLFVGNPLYKVPDDPCDNNLAWSTLDLTALPDDYLPRCKYVPALSDAEYQERLDQVPWSKQKVTDFYRLALREFVGLDSERSLQSAIVPKGMAHINKVESIVFNNNSLIEVAGVFQALVTDFYIRTIGKQDMLPELLNSIPLPDFSEAQKHSVYSRVLALNCLTSYYGELWEQNFAEYFKEQRWSGTDEALDQEFFSKLTPTWQRNNALRSDLMRRQALLELDVIIAQAFGLTLHELQTCYELGFRVLKSYEEGTYYDRRGRIVFTPNGSLHVGLPSAAKPDAGVSYAVNGVHKERLSFAEVQDLKAGSVTKTFTDTTLPEPVQRTIVYEAPFFKKDRLSDYAQAWQYFESLHRDNK